MITLPASGPKPLYYSTFVGYFKEILRYLSIPFQLKGVAEHCYFVTKFDDKEVVFNFSDFYEIPKVNEYKHYFKFHYSKEEHSKYENVYPFAPVSFYDWGKYKALKAKIKYTGNSNIILNMQRSYGDAVERRTSVQKILRERYGGTVKTNYTLPQVDYWKKINNCLVHIFVPGVRNDMIDRGHVQYMAFGCCTIAPPIADVLPYNGELVSGTHYIQCSPDYSDLIDKVEWCKNNRERCVEIGNNAKRLFEQSCLPNRLWKWVLEKIND